MYLLRDIYLSEAIKILPATGELSPMGGHSQLVPIVTVPDGNVCLALVRICISKSPYFASSYRISWGKYSLSVLSPQLGQRETSKEVSIGSFNSQHLFTHVALLGLKPLVSKHYVLKATSAAVDDGPQHEKRSPG